VRRGVAVDAVVSPDPAGIEPVEGVEHVDAHVRVVVLVHHDRRGRVRRVDAAQTLATSARATISATRAVRSIISRFVVVRMRTR
jgi:hypothetical protein